MCIRQDRRKTGIVLSLVVTLCSATRATDKIQPLNIKLGLWEVTTTVRTSEEMPIPAGFLEKLTPEQRARIQDRIEARKSEPGKTTVKKRCLSRKQLDDGVPLRPDLKSCTGTLLTSTGSKVDMHVECFEKGIKSDGTFLIEALTSETVKGSVDFSANGGASPTKTISTFTARWIGPSCSMTK